MSLLPGALCRLVEAAVQPTCLRQCHNMCTSHQAECRLARARYQHTCFQQRCQGLLSETFAAGIHCRRLLRGGGLGPLEQLLQQLLLDIPIGQQGAAPIPLQCSSVSPSCASVHSAAGDNKRATVACASCKGRVAMTVSHTGVHGDLQGLQSQER